jgi:hypothetical protein
MFNKVYKKNDKDLLNQLNKHLNRPYPTIGFFGDSFCANISSNDEKFETYIMKLIKKNKLKLYSLGVRGSSIWDTILIQFLPLYKEDKFPDIIIFVWTNETRLFHRDIRDITVGTSREKTDEIYKAADQYYTNFLDRELMQFQYVSALRYFDSEILSKVPSNKKIIHFRSFENEWLEKYNFKWQNGIEINLVLNSLTDPETFTAANHIYGERKNQILFESIQNVLENWDTIQLTKNPGII